MRVMQKRIKNLIFRASATKKNVAGPEKFPRRHASQDAASRNPRTAGGTGSDQHHLSADLGKLEQLGDVLVVKTDAAVRRLSPDLARVMGAVDAVVLP